MSLELSVIIPTRDRPAALAEMLGSVARGRFPAGRYEVLVADNGTGGETAAVVESFRGRIDPLVYLRVPQPGLHEARHAGLAAAKSELLVFADDDIIAGPDWLGGIHAAFQDPRVGLVGGSNRPRFLEPPPEWLRRLWQAGGRCLPELSLLELDGPGRPFSPYLIFGCNFAVRRQVVLAAGGFHPDGFPADRLRYRGDGETHIANHAAASGWVAWFTPAATVEHVVPAGRMTAAYFEQRNFADGVSASYAHIRARAEGVPPGLPPSVRWSPRTLARLLFPPRLAPLRWRFWNARRRGARFHRQAVAEDSALLAWVRRDNYF